MTDRLPPQAIDIERTVLGAMLNDRKAAAKGLELLNECDFHPEKHRKIFIAMREMHAEGAPADSLRRLDKFPPCKF